MGIALDLTTSGNSMTLASTRLAAAELGQPSLDTPISRNPLSLLQQIASEVMLTLEESRLTGFEALEK